ncbi:DnaA regulatory inactivator Hda [Thiolapillus sp.]|uniref:DnaA regulatory inactivator Hda n=1 Tax=Thiolapillus sp. TaxID=2017437 RepID=UPI0025E25004|nr:DnaA regulatory inactivator Hda [Thiolapillus sp.]
MTRQLPLPVELAPQAELADFIAGDNLQLIDLLQRIAAGSNDEILFISGGPGSGKTHLLMGLCRRAEQQSHSCAYLPLDELRTLSPALLAGMEAIDILAVDGVQYIAGRDDWEEALFILFNLARDEGRSLVFSADRGPKQLALALPDLRSRLSWGSSYRLQPLDDTGLMELLQTQAQKRGLQLKPKVAQWLLRHCSRSPGNLLGILGRLDQKALAEKRHNLSLPFVQSCL